MKVVEVIPSRVWKHAVSGRTASPYGAVPWTSETDREGWTLCDQGFTWRLDNGTVGLGRRPAATREEAIAIMHRFNERAKGATS